METHRDTWRQLETQRHSMSISTWRHGDTPWIHMERLHVHIHMETHGDMETHRDKETLHGDMEKWRHMETQ